MTESAPKRQPIGFRQIAAQLRERIDSGEFRENTRLPTEASLGEKYGVGRSAVRRAYQELMNDGDVVKKEGVGYFVLESDLRALTMIDRNGRYNDPWLSVTQGSDRFHQVAVVEVLPASTAIRDTPLSGLMDIDADIPRVACQRLVRHMGDRPLMITWVYMPLKKVMTTAFMDAQALQVQTPLADAASEILEGAPLTRVVDRIYFRGPTREEIDALGLSPGAGVVEIVRRMAFNGAFLLVEHSVTAAPGVEVAYDTTF